MRRAIRSGTRTALEGAGVGPEGRWTGVGRAAPGVRYCLRRLGACGLALMLLVACSPEGGAEARGDARVSRDAVGDEVRREDTRPVVLFLGTSLTAGYGLPESEAFPARIQARIDAAGLDYRVVNAGVSGDTSAGGLRRLDWLLRLPVAVLVLELGANDMLRGQGVDALRANLEAIVDRTRAAHPDARIVIAGMLAAPNLGPDYARAFDAVYPELAERAGAALVPFLLEDVAARRELNQADGIHPTADGHARIAERIWQTLEPVLQERVGSDRVLDPH
ncbi:MAG: arylesterase [Myxococcota bacterium]